MALTAAQFFAFLGPRQHEIHWNLTPGGGGAGVLELRLIVQKGGTGLDSWMVWRQAAADYQTALLGLAQQVQADVTAIGG